MFRWTTRAHHHERICLAEVIGALSYALDITEGQPEGHAACITAAEVMTILDKNAMGGGVCPQSLAALKSWLTVSHLTPVSLAA